MNLRLNVQNNHSKLYGMTSSTWSLSLSVNRIMCKSGYTRLAATLGSFTQLGKPQ